LNLQKEMAKSANRIESLKTDAEQWFVGTVNKMDFNKWFEKEDKASKTLVKIVKDKFESDFIPEIIKEGKRFYKAVFNETAKLGMDNDWIKIADKRLDNARLSWYNNFELQMAMLNRSRKTKDFMQTDWDASMPSMQDQMVTSRGRKQKRLKITGGGVYYYPLWKELDKAISESYVNLATKYKNRVING